MTGRLNAVDLATDLYLLAIATADLSPRALAATLARVDPDPFPFDQVVTDYTEFIRTLRMFRSIHQIDPITPGAPIALTAAGENMAETLHRELTPEQRTAFQDALPNTGGVA